MRLFLICVSTIIIISCRNNNGELQQTDTIVQSSPNSNVSYLDTLVRDSSSIYQSVIPEEVLRSIDKITGWRLPKPAAFESYFYTYYKTDSSLINFIAADFNCDDEMDYALILENEEKDYGAWILLAGKEDYEAVKLVQRKNTSKYIGLGLELLAKGKKISDIGLIGTPESKTITLKCTALHVLYLETSSQAYFWDQGKFNSIFTTD
ncbi:MAG: hypothetical protein V4708_18560 [Bacteroidota bacterium]